MRTAPTLTVTLLALLTSMTLLGAAPRQSVPQAMDLTPAFRSNTAGIDQMKVFEIGGVVVIRGRAVDAAAAEQAGVYARGLGYERVANLVQVIEAPDDAAIARRVERELTRHRALEGCRFAVSSHRGVISLAGSVQHELQKDVAMTVLRNVDGVREVRSELVKN